MLASIAQGLGEEAVDDPLILVVGGLIEERGVVLGRVAALGQDREHDLADRARSAYYGYFTFVFHTFTNYI